MVTAFGTSRVLEYIGEKCVSGASGSNPDGTVSWKEE